VVTTTVNQIYTTQLCQLAGKTQRAFGFDYVPELTLLLAEERRRLLNCLRPPDMHRPSYYRVNCKAAVRARTQNNCLWLQTEAFVRNWIQGNVPEMLWITGESGTGKTVSAGSIIGDAFRNIDAPSES